MKKQRPSCRGRCAFTFALKLNTHASLVALTVRLCSALEDYVRRFRCASRQAQWQQRGVVVLCGAEAIQGLSANHFCGPPPVLWRGRFCRVRIMQADRDLRKAEESLMDDLISEIRPEASSRDQTACEPHPSFPMYSRQVMGGLTYLPLSAQWPTPSAILTTPHFTGTTATSGSSAAG